MPVNTPNIKVNLSCISTIKERLEHSQDGIAKMFVKMHVIERTLKIYSALE